jgi:AcrR family transcriptional regulator
VGANLELLTAGAPRPLLSRSAEKRLGHRHVEVLDQLEEMFQTDGVASFTIAELAAGVGCSRRTLYELAPSKDQLVLVVLDRLLHKKGRASLAKIKETDPIVEQLRAYITGGVHIHLNASVFDDMAEDPAGLRVIDTHYRYVMTVLERLVALGIERGELASHLNPALIAAILAGASQYLSQPEILSLVAQDEADALHQLLDLLAPALNAETVTPIQ